MKKLIIFSILVLSAFLAACGGGEPEAPEARTIEYNFSNEFVFEPAQISAKTGTPINLKLNNANAAVSHSWFLVPADTDLEGDAADIEAKAIGRAASGEIAAGDSSTVNFIAPEPGTYKFVCTVAGHITGGMVGDMVVTE